MIFNLKALLAFVPIFGRLSLVLQIICERNVCSELFERFTDECLFAWTFASMTFSAALPPYSIVSPQSHGNSAPQVPELQIHKHHFFFFFCSHQKLTQQIFLTYFIFVKSRVLVFCFVWDFWVLGGFLGFFESKKNYFNWCLRRREGQLVCKYYQGKPAVFSQITVNVLGFSD